MVLLCSSQFYNAATITPGGNQEDDMLTSAEIDRQFKQELQNLLDSWDAEMEADDHYQGYPECGQDVRIEVTIPSIYDTDGNQTREFTVIDLGRIIFPTED
jgi:hypothetical protein